MPSINEVRLYTDGGCRGNPGPGAIGLVILDVQNNELRVHSEIIGECTNNRAEYKALIRGLGFCAGYTRRKVCCFLDSELVVRQMTGVYRLKDAVLRGLFQEVKNAELPFDEVIYQHVPRTNQYIRKADRLLNEAFEGRFP
jgi:ribonuclease HI